jgi:hypothetical protein
VLAPSEGLYGGMVSNREPLGRIPSCECDTLKLKLLSFVAGLNAAFSGYHNKNKNRENLKPTPFSLHQFLARLLVCSSARLLVCSSARLLVCSSARLLLFNIARIRRRVSRFPYFFPFPLPLPFAATAVPAFPLGVLLVFAWPLPYCLSASLPLLAFCKTWR